VSESVAVADGDPARWPDAGAAYDVMADAYAAQFLTELDHKPHDRDLLSRFAEALDADGAHPVCDLGCGPGHIGAFLATVGVDVLGIDLSAAMVREARRQFPSLRFRQGDMTALPLADGELAGIVCFYALIHVPRSFVAPAVSEMHRVVRPGGQVLVAVHGGTGSLHAREMVGRPVDLKATLFELGELRGYFTGAGFEVLDAHERAPYPGEHPTPRLYLWASRPR